MPQCIKCKKDIPDDAKFCPSCGQNQKKSVKAHLKRPNGSGAVYKLGERRRKPWVAVTSDKQYLGTFETKTKAEMVLLDYRIAPPAPKAGYTLLQLYDEWSEIKFKNALGSSKRAYRSAWCYFANICDKKVSEIRSGEYQKIIDEAGETHKHPTLNGIRTLASQLSGYAMQNDIINKNYASFIKMPPLPETTKTAFNEVELKKIEKAAADGVPFADCVLMMCYTGWRIEEFLSLTKFSYDPKNDTLTGGLKTAAGKGRIVPVHPKIKPYLLNWLAKGGETIICQKNGKKFEQGHFRKERFAPALEAIGVRPLKPHECRHTFSTLLHRNHADSVSAKEMMGHASYDTDEKTYIHVNVDELRRAIEKI